MRYLAPMNGRLLGALLLVVAAGCPGPTTPAPVAAAATPALPHAWPPQVGQPYPDLELLDHRGKTVRLSSFRGKVLVIEPIGMACPACQAYAGAHRVGAFRDARPQGGLPSFEELLSQHAGLERSAEPDLVWVQLLLYDMSSRRAPTVEDAAAWANHFGVADAPNVVVLAGDARYVNPASYALVPGFQVVDRAFTLRWDGAGHHPPDHPYDVALAGIPGLLADR
jgi:hypothetical protein